MGLRSALYKVVRLMGDVNAVKVKRMQGKRSVRSGY